MNEPERIQQAVSPSRLAWRRLRRNRPAMAAAMVLAFLYVLAIFAGFFSPYSPTDREFRSHFFHPPTPLYFRAPSGALQMRPSVHATYLADNRRVRYAEDAPAAICYKHAAANLNPYLAETLESTDPILTIRDEMGQMLYTITSIQETAENSGIFCTRLALDSHLLLRTQSIRAESKYGDYETFKVVDGESPADPAAASRTLYLQNQNGEPASSYSKMIQNVPLQFFVHGWRYRILWFFQSDLHLFGTAEPAHIFLLGTDQSGRDLFSRVLFGSQISLTVGLFAVILTSLFGLLIGGIAGYYGGGIDTLIMRFSEVLLSIPPLYLLLTLSNTIPQSLQETYDRIHQLVLQTFAWQGSPGTFAAVVSVIVLSLSYYCLRGKWSRGRILVSVLVASMAVFGSQILGASLDALQWFLPGTTHLTSDWTYLFVIVILSAVGWAGMARVIRGMVLPLRDAEFVLAARALGSRDSRVIVRHILPNTFGYVIVRATMLIPLYILAEVSLSFLGLGVQEPIPSWGNMLTQAQNLRVLTQFSWTLAPGFLIFFTVLAYNILGDGLRDALDPRQI